MLESLLFLTQHLLCLIFFLHGYENKWLPGTKKRGLQKGRFFSNIFSFIDDLCSIKIKKKQKGILPLVLELKKESKATSTA